MNTASGCLFLHPNYLHFQVNISSKRFSCRVADAGLLFNEKIRYLSSYLQINTQRALTRNPTLRTTPLSTFQSVVAAFSSFGFTKMEISRILDMHPILLTADPDQFLYPVIDFLLNEALIPFSDIPKSISRCPRLLVSSVRNRLRPNLEYLNSLGFTAPESINSRTTLLLVYDKDYTFASKIDYLIELGFLHSEVKKMVVRSPSILTYSVEKNIRPKARYLLDEIGRELSELQAFPQYFSYSLEGKIKPRHKMLVHQGVRLPLSEMLKVSDGEFSTLLVEMALQRGGGGAR